MMNVDSLDIRFVWYLASSQFYFFYWLDYKIISIWNCVSRWKMKYFGWHNYVEKFYFPWHEKVVTLVCLPGKLIGDTHLVVIVDNFSDKLCHRKSPFYDTTLLSPLQSVTTSVTENLSSVTPNSCHCCHHSVTYTLFCHAWLLVSRMQGHHVPLSPKIISDKNWTFGDKFSCHQTCFFL